MAKGGTQDTRTTTTTQLSPEQQQILGLSMPGIQQFAAATPKRYGGSTIAGFDPSQEKAQGMALDASMMQDWLAGQGVGAANTFLGGDIWKPESNPNLQGAISAATRPITQNLTESILPSIRGEAGSTGNFGSSRQGIAEGLASGRASQAVGDTASKLVQDQYSTNINAQLKALGMLPMLQDSTLAGARTTGAVGDVRQAMDQARLNEQVSNFNFDQYAPFLKSKELLALLQGIPGGSTTAVGTGPARNPLMGALGGAATGASLGSAFGPWGTGIGAVGGGLLSLFS